MMPGVVFTETLRQSWRGMLIWGLSIGALVFIQIIAIPDVQSLQQVTELMQSLPPVLLQALGAGDMNYLATPEGYLAVRWFGFGVLIFFAYAVVVGLRVSSSDEDRGVLDLVLSTPVPRWRLLLERTLAYTLLIIALLIVVFAFTVLAIVVTPSMQVNMGNVVNAQINMLPPILFVLGFTVCLAGAIRRRGVVVGLVIGVLVASYFLDTIASAVVGSPLEALGWLSFLRFYDASGVMQSGLRLADAGVLSVLAIGLAGLGIVLFQQRDTGR